jgi:predicted nucleic acid-binding protein
MADSRLFVDTRGWLVLANARDPSFGAVSRLRAEVVDRTGAWVTTDYVLDEALMRLFATTPFALARRFAEGIFTAAQRELLDIELITAERFTAAWRLRLRLHDKPGISFTDLD